MNSRSRVMAVGVAQGFSLSLALRWEAYGIYDNKICKNACCECTISVLTSLTTRRITVITVLHDANKAGFQPKLIVCANRFGRNESLELARRLSILRQQLDAPLSQGLDSTTRLAYILRSRTMA
eukprot:6175426-Pleurochrysis_carterae.AAC.2